MSFALADSTTWKRKQTALRQQIVFDAGQKVEVANIIAVLKSTKSIPEDFPADGNTDLNTIARLYEENLEKEEDEMVNEFFPLDELGKEKGVMPQVRAKKQARTFNAKPPEKERRITFNKGREMAKKYDQAKREASHGTSRLGFAEDHLKSKVASSYRDSDTTVSKAIRHAKGCFCSLFHSRKPLEDEENPSQDRRKDSYDSSDSKNTREEYRRVSVREARAKRRRLKQQKQFQDNLTYFAVLFVAILRIITTLIEIFESDEHWILLQALLRFKKINCIAVYTWFPDLWPLVLYIYFLACCLLPVLLNTNTEGFYLIWMAIHAIYSGCRISHIPRQYIHKDILLTDQVIYVHIAFFVLDILCFTIVMIRYYHWANPVAYRDKYSNTLLGDYLVNDYIQFMVQSSFIRKKTAIQRATAFQVLTIVRKLKEKYRTTGTYPSQATINKEVDSAIRALNDWKKFPALRIIHAFELKEQLMNEKSQLRRQRIREMKDKFNQMMKDTQRKEKLRKDARDKARKHEDKKVVLNELGYAAPVPRKLSDKTIPSVSSLTHDPRNLGLQLKGQMAQDDNVSSRQVLTGNDFLRVRLKPYFEEREHALKDMKAAKDLSA